MQEALRPGMIETITLSGIGSLWFLPTLFFASLLAYPAMKSGIGSAILFFIAILFTYSGNVLNEILYTVCGGTPDPWQGCIYTVIVRSIVSSGIVVMGYYLKILDDIIVRQSAAKRFTIIICCLLISICVCPFIELDYRTLQFGQHPLLMFISVGVIFLFFINIFRAIENAEYKEKKAFDALRFFGRNSLIILATHLEWFFVEILSKGMDSTFSALNHTGLHYYARCFVILAGVMALEYALITIINNIFPWLIRFPFNSSR